MKRFWAKAGLRGAGGQIALFLVLIFQALFILFAMTLNMALTVHDKINFQNALDLGALYGAKKQAEVLNALAHINFQLRQNYKLLAWRYRILGTLTQEGGHHGYDPASSSTSGEPYWCPQNKDLRGGIGTIPCNLTQARAGTPAIKNLCLKASLRYPNYCDISYAVCISSDLWDRTVKAGGQNICRLRVVSFPPIPELNRSGSPFPWERAAARNQRILQHEADRSCKSEGALNWLMAQLFLTHFRLDQKDRKLMMEAIYNKTLKKSADLDGTFIIESAIEKGVEETVRKNLTFVNNASFNSNTLNHFNSFKNKTFEQIFEPLKTFPVLMYLAPTKTVASSSGTNCNEPDVRPHFVLPDALRTHLGSGRGANHRILTDEPDLGDDVRRLIETKWPFFLLNNKSVAPSANKAAALVWSYHRNPDYQLYYGLSGKLKQISGEAPQLFTPGIDPVLKGSAFAKPFGGRIGPEGGDSADPLILPVGSDLNNAIARQPNHSRWPGDKWGLIDRKLHSGPKALLKKRHGHKDAPYTGTDHFNTPKKSPYRLHYFTKIGHIDDPLARTDSGEPFLLFLRMMEMMAVLPDVYDLINYSISNNYMETYFPKICKLITAEGVCPPNPAERRKIQNTPGSIPGYVRGDFGWPETPKYREPNIGEQGVTNSFLPLFYFDGPDRVKLSKLEGEPGSGGSPPREPQSANEARKYTGDKSRHSYMLRDPAHFLTAWAPTIKPERYHNYNSGASANDYMFAKCYKQTPEQPDAQIPSGCVEGGRSGYSIKLISCNFAKTLNPPPPTDF